MGSRNKWGRTYEVGHHDADPCDKSADGGKVEEPVENGCRTGRNAEIDQTREGGAEEDRDPRDSVLVACAEDRRCLTGDGKRVEGSGTGEKEGVACRPGRSQDDGVDDVVEALDPSSLDAEHERTRASVGFAGIDSLQKLWVIGCDNNADDQGSENVEDAESVDESTGRLGDVTPGSFGLPCAQDN